MVQIITSQPVSKSLKFRMTQREFDDIVKVEGNAGPRHEEVLSVSNSSLHISVNAVADYLHLYLNVDATTQTIPVC